MPSQARRKENRELAHGRTFEDEGRRYIIQQWNLNDEFAYFQLWDCTDPESPDVVGRFSRAVSCARVQSLAYRYRHPETERYPEDGIIWTDTLKTLQRPKRGKKNPYTTYYVRIPKSIVEKYDIRIDDEVSVRVGETNKAESWDEWYHVSRLGDGLAVILSKMARHDDATLAKIGEGEHIIIEMKAHPCEGRTELGVCAPVIWAICATMNQELDPLEDIKDMTNPDKEDKPKTIFNDF